MSRIPSNAECLKNRQQNVFQINKTERLNFVLQGPGVERSLSAQGQTHEVPSCVTIICFHGSGHDTHYNTWLLLVEDIAKSTTILYYERQGVVQDPEVVARYKTPRESMTDLIGLLDHLRLEPPYILLAHSYGGTIAREFLQSYPNRVAGMVLAETGQETPSTFDQEQYRKQILGSNPLSVIHANSLHGKANGLNSVEATKMHTLWAEEDMRMKKAQLQLSSNARYIRIDDCGHNVIRDRPDVVRQEVDWVLEHTVASKAPNVHRFAHVLQYITRVIRQKKT